MWRLIPLLNADGVTQMAVDRWLLQQHQQGKQPSILRFYTWSPAAISLGYHQRQIPETWKQLQWQGKLLDLVHRPTGGRAVLHQGDLTYAVITSELTGKRLEVYGKICQFLIQGWRSLGINLDYGSAKRGYIHNPNCFGTATRADLITPEGYKFIGSAQWIKDGAILQHGSMRLFQDFHLYSQIFGESSAALFQLPQQLQQKEEIEIIETIIATLTQAARECFQTDFVIQPLSSQELKAVSEVQS